VITFKDIPDFSIDSDERQYILREKKVVESGKNAGQETWVPISFHSSLPHVLQALSRLLHRRKIASGRSTLEGAVKSLQEIEQRIRAAGGEDGN
jgi:hypothetical protein